MNTSTTIRTVAAALLASAALTAAVVAHAVPAGDPPSVVIKYDPALAATDQGARDLYRRIARAADQVCPEGSSRSLTLSAIARQCRQDAVARAVGVVHERHLVEIAAAHANRG